MNLKDILIGLILVVIIVLGIVKIIGTIGGNYQESPSYMEETVNLPQKVRSLTETREKQIKEREAQLDYE